MKLLPAISAGRLAVFRWGSSLSVILATLTVSAQTNFCKAITSKTSVTLHGCMVVDSFNSLDPSHSTNGKYDAAKRLDGADIACVSDTLSVITDTGNTRVYGHFGTGPSGKVTLSGTASVGSIAWVDGGSRGIQPGWYANDLQLEIPDAVLPNITFSTLSQSSSRVGGTNYNYVLGTGNYKSSTALSLKGQNMCINGKVTIYLPSGLQISGQGYIYVAPGASLTIYLGGQSQMAGGGTINGSGFATNCSLIGLPTCTSIQYTGGSGFVGIIYAPNADVNVSGGGSQTLNFVGSLVAKTASVTGNYQFHYDQALCSNCPKPTVAFGPASATVCAGSSVLFNVGASGNGLKYQWYKNGTPLVGRTNSSINLASVGAMDVANYCVVVGTACGGVVTNCARLDLNVPVSASALEDVAVCAGGHVRFSTVTTGAVLSYTWTKNGTVLAGKSSSSLDLDATTEGDAGTYSVVVMGACNTITNSAALTVNLPLIVSRPPSNANVCSGTSARFQIDATGTGLTYQWYKGATMLVGQTASILTLDNLSPLDAAIFKVVVNGPCAGSVTNVAELTVNQPTAVVQPLANVTNCPGANAIFSVGALGSGLSYQWYRGTTLLNGQTNATVNLSNLQPSDSDNYSVVVSSVCGSSVTVSARLSVRQPALVVSPPRNATNCPGANVSFSMDATGSDLTYQWYQENTLLVGQTNSTLNLQNILATDAGNYKVVVTGFCGRSITNSAILAVNQPMLLVNPPISITSCPGANLTFSVGATGSGLNYQWFRGSTLLIAQTNAFLGLQNITAADAGIYSVVVTGACGDALTNAAFLSVNQPALVVNPPTNVTNCPGANVTFSVGAIGTGLSYQWFRGNTLLFGKTNATLNLPNITAADGGSYAVVVTGACGNGITNSTSLAVNQPALVVNPPASVTNCPGANVTLLVGATGTGLNFQWFRGSTLLTGQTNASLGLQNITAADAGIYGVVVTGICGGAVTNSAVLSVNQPALVVNPPVNVTNCLGANAVFRVSATGTGLRYQWYRSNTMLIGETNAALSLPSIGDLDAGRYSVVVTGVCSGTITNSANLVVNQPALVVNPPANVTNCPGANVTFSVGATGTGLNYQWLRGSILLIGQTNASLGLQNITAADAGNYSVIVIGACGGPLTNNVFLSVNQPALVVNPPTNVTNCPGANVTFSVGATGTGLTYQWFRGNTLLFGQTNATLNLPNITAADGGSYAVVVTGACGGAITNSTTLAVNQPALVVNPPANLTNCPGANVTFSVGATGTGLSYSWFRGGTILPGQTSSALILQNITAADAGSYGVVVAGTCGSPITNRAALSVNQPALVITPPTNVTNCSGANVTFNVGATGTGLTYQWFRGNTLLFGRTNATLLLPSIAAADAGNYSIVVTGTCGSSITNSTILAVNQPAVVMNPPVNITNCPGANATFTVGATGTGLNYQWFRGSTLLIAQTNASLGLQNITAADAGIYSVAVTGSCGEALTNAAFLSVNQAVLVVNPPTNVTNCPGANVTFSVGATGTGLTYQWFRGNMLLPGQTNFTLSLPVVSAADAGSYGVIVTGRCGSAATNSAILTVNQPTIVVSPPVNVTNCPGANVSFSLSATGTGLTYQWFRENTLLPGQTNAALNLQSITPFDAGNYRVVVNGTCGSSVTNGVILSVNQPALVVNSPVNVTNCSGGNATFSVAATGSGLTYQWYQGESLLFGRTNAALTIDGLTAVDAGKYVVIVQGSCGPSVTNSAFLFVNTPVNATALSSQVHCAGDTATFETIASGSGPFTYVWRKDGIIVPGAKNPSLTLRNLRDNDNATYSVEVSGLCGTVSNAALLIVNASTSASSLSSVTKNLGSDVVFATLASGVGPFTYVWKLNGVIIPGAISNSLTIANIGFSSAGEYQVEVTALCGTAVQRGTLTVNVPPTVSIVNPTNGTVFLAPATFPVIAEAQDTDGFITKVEFYAGLSNQVKISETTNVPPYFVLQTNLPVGTYRFLATATDNQGAMATSAPVNVTVISNLPLVVSGPIRLNYQTGFYEQTAHVLNPTPLLLSAVGVIVYNLPNDWRVQNASFVTNGLPGVLYNQPVLPGGSADVTVKYFLGPNAHTNDIPVLVAIEHSPATSFSVAGTSMPISRELILGDGTVLLNFVTLSGATYYVLYSSDLINWKTSAQPVQGTGYSAQWLDYGHPATDGLPKNQAQRFYRVLRVF